MSRVYPKTLFEPMFLFMVELSFNISFQSNVSEDIILDQDIFLHVKQKLSATGEKGLKHQSCWFK